MIERHERYFVDRNKQQPQFVIDHSIMFHLRIEEIEEMEKDSNSWALRFPQIRGSRYNRQSRGRARAPRHHRHSNSKTGHAKPKEPAKVLPLNPTGSFHEKIDVIFSPWERAE